MDGGAGFHGWDARKVAAFKAEYDNFKNYVVVNSKDKGVIQLGEHTYRAQRRFVDGIYDGLAKDIHDFKVLKSRQLGISTESRCFTLFWCGVHDGLKGYMILDTDAHKEEARIELIGMIESLPKSVRFPRIKRQNRTLLELENGSILMFAAAGVSARKSSGVLGRGSGVNFVHASEVCSWENTEGLESFMNSLSDEYPDRLYIWESTARGYNQWKDMWDEAREDNLHQYCIFIGWWARDNQMIPRDHADFLRYGVDPPTDKEIARIRAVKEQYGWDITPEQLAWVRRKMDPTAKPEGDAPAEYHGSLLRLQEQPWVEIDAFQMTGSAFFAPEDLTAMMNKSVSRKFKTYSYSGGIEFTDMRIYPAPNARSVELKVWDEPETDAIYVVSADVAFGANEKNDRSAVQVLRCYSDGIDQVAEYAWPLVNSRQFAWVIASLLGWYAGDTNEVYLILELNGPGEATWTELQSLKRQMSMGYQPQAVDERGLRDIFRNVKNFLYTRTDSMTPGRAYQWKTTINNKITLMERLRDFTSNGMLRIRSADTLEEMRFISREGDQIEAAGRKKDDRAIALALGIRCWEDRARRIMTSQQRTRENEAAKRRLTIRDQAFLLNKYQLTEMFNVKNRARDLAIAQARRAQWRGRR